MPFKISVPNLEILLMISALNQGMEHLILRGGFGWRLREHRSGSCTATPLRGSSKKFRQQIAGTLETNVPSQARLNSGPVDRKFSDACRRIGIGPKNSKCTRIRRTADRCLRTRGSVHLEKPGT